MLSQLRIKKKKKRIISLELIIFRYYQMRNYVMLSNNIQIIYVYLILEFHHT